MRLAVVPAAGLMHRRFPVVAGLAQSTATGGVVGVESGVDEFAAGLGEVVGDGGNVTTQDTQRVTVEHLAAEASVSCAGVSPVSVAALV